MNWGPINFTRPIVNQLIKLDLVGDLIDVLYQSLIQSFENQVTDSNYVKLRSTLLPQLRVNKDLKKEFQSSFRNLIFQENSNFRDLYSQENLRYLYNLLAQYIDTTAYDEDFEKELNEIIREGLNNYFSVCVNNLSEKQQLYFLLNINEKILSEFDVLNEKSDAILAAVSNLNVKIGSGRLGLGVQDSEIEYSGALIIDELFVEQLKSGTAYSPESFYTAKQDDNCQWYGIHNNYDVIRKDYDAIAEIAKKSFDKHTLSKVSILIHGTGGSGKSTVLRRLAIELSRDTPYEVLWINDFELEKFVSESLDLIKSNHNTKYIVFLEDWYRNVDFDPSLGDRLLKVSQTIPNIRLIIGDRDIKGKRYRNYLMNDKCVFELQESENKNIINEIVRIIPKWEESVQEIFKKEENYNSSLFYLLFVINGVNSDRIGEHEVNSDIKNMAKNLALHDMKIIMRLDEGVAKALFYWSNVYKEYKIFITPKGFEELSVSLSDSNKSKMQYINWEDDDELLNKLKLYIHVKRNESIKRLADMKFIQFNHDILAEDIISEVMFSTWDEYNNSKKKELLDKIMSFSDQITKSVYLSKIIKSEQHLFNDNSVLLKYIDQLLYDEKNYDFAYLSGITYLNLSHEKLKQYMDVLDAVGVFSSNQWLTYFKIAPKKDREEAAKYILDNENLNDFQSEIVVGAFQQTGNKKEKIAAAKNILAIDDLESVQKDIVVAAFKQKGNGTEKISAAKQILGKENIDSIQYDIVLAAFRLHGNEREKIAAAKKILESDNIGEIQKEIVVESFRQRGNKEEKVEAAKKILESENIESIQPDIVLAAFRQSGNNKQKEIVSKRILENEEIEYIIFDIVVAAFRQPGNEKEKVAAAKRILDNEDIESVQPDTLVAAFRQKGNEGAKTKAARVILTNENIDSLQHHIVVAAFQQQGNEDVKISAAKLILENEKIDSLQHDIVIAAFRQEGNDEDKVTVAKQILNHENIYALQHHIVVEAFRQDGNESEKLAAAKRILENEDVDTVQKDVLVEAFRLEGNETEKENAVKQSFLNKDLDDLHVFIVNELLWYSALNQRLYPEFEQYINMVIKRNYSSQSKINVDRYFTIMGIPFEGVLSWDLEMAKIMRKWRSMDRRAVICQIKYLSTNPLLIKDICLEIIRNWKKELKNPIPQIYGPRIYGTHIILSLCNPVIAGLVDGQIDEMHRNMDLLPPRLMEVVENIKSKNEYPTWDFRRK